MEYTDKLKTGDVDYQSMKKDELVEICKAQAKSIDSWESEYNKQVERTTNVIAEANRKIEEVVTEANSTIKSLNKQIVSYKTIAVGALEFLKPLEGGE